MENDYRYILLMDENKEKCLKIGFFGYTDEMIQNYLKNNYIDNKNEYCKKWVKMKEIYCK